MQVAELVEAEFIKPCPDAWENFPCCSLNAHRATSNPEHPGSPKEVIVNPAMLRWVWDATDLLQACVVSLSSIAVCAVVSAQG